MRSMEEKWIKRYFFSALNFWLILDSVVKNRTLTLLKNAFFIFRKQKRFAIFLPYLNIWWPLKTKVKKIIFHNCILDKVYNEKKNIYRGLFVGYRIRFRIRVTQKDQIRPDPDPKHWFKPFCIWPWGYLNILVQEEVCNPRLDEVLHSSHRATGAPGPINQ